MNIDVKTYTALIKRLESIEAMASVLINEATKAREQLQQQESGNSPAARKGKVSNEIKARVLAKYRKTQLRKRA